MRFRCKIGLHRWKVRYQIGIRYRVCTSCWDERP